MTAWPTLYQRVSDWRGDLPEGGALWEPKIDGFRMMRFRGIDGHTRLWTRNGHPIEGAEHITHHLGLMEQKAGQPLFFDGEYQVDGTLDATKRWVESGWKLGGEAGHYHAFDVLTFDEWRAGGTDRPLIQRKAMLAELLKAVADDEGLSWEWRAGSRGRDEGRCPVTVMPDEWVFDAADAIMLTKLAWATGGEGGVVKRAEGGYQRSRSAEWARIKPGGPWQRAVAA